jgi:hypothetical protein
MILPAFYATLRFITVFTRVRHWFLYPEAHELRPQLIFKTHFNIIHLRLGLPSGLFAQSLPTRILCIISHLSCAC